MTLRTSVSRRGALCATVAAMVLAGGGTGALNASDRQARPVDWAAVAPATVEPRRGFVRLSAALTAPVAQIRVVVGQKVAAGDLLVTLDDAPQRASLAGAKAEVAFRKSERDAALSGDKARNAARDRIASAETAVTRARDALDQARGAGSDAAAARKALSDAQSEREAALRAFDMLAVTGPAKGPTRVESALAIARGELQAARADLDRTRIRAPQDGTVLRLPQSVGELAEPSGKRPLAVIGDLSSLRLKAEVDERDISRVAQGQAVMVRTLAGNTQIRGSVSSVAPIVRPKRLATDNPGEPMDKGVVEVLVALEPGAALLPGQRVDAYFMAKKGDGDAISSN